ncbi:tyrosine-type recombinase/integrase [Microbacterium sp. UBA3486]|uniref:tyrosine-type recombinase/integrase n=1 Tax=Microbacterium sp. UBA3486 TaxID=1946947 RepID=UPI0039C9F019
MDSIVQCRVETIATDEDDIEVEPRSCSVKRRGYLRAPFDRRSSRERQHQVLYVEGRTHEAPKEVGIGRFASWSEAAEMPLDSVCVGPDHDALVVTGIRKYESAKGVRYKARYRKPDGREGSKAGFRTEASAKAFLRDLEQSRAHGTFVDPARGRETIAVVAEEWLTRRRAATAQRNGKLSTLARVEGIVEKHIIPVLGDHRVGALTQADVDAWVNTLSGEAESIRKYVSVLRGIMKHAMRSKRIAVNPVHDLTLPKVVRQKKRYLSHEQVTALHDAVNRTNDGESHGYGVITTLLAYCGLRWSEVSGLRIDDVDFEKRRIHIGHTIVLVGGRQVEDVPKNYEAREVPIPGFLATMLTEHVERREIEIVEDIARLTAHLERITTREQQIADLRTKYNTMTAYIAEVTEARRVLNERIAGINADRVQRIATELPYEALDESIARAERKLARLPRPEVLTKRRDGIPAKIERLEKRAAKDPRQKEIIEQGLAALAQKPLFVGARTRTWLRNATFRSGWLTPAVALMDAEARAAALKADLPIPRPLGDLEPHELRHTCASLAVSAGANVKVVQRLLGHEKASVTLDVYSDLFETDLDDVARRMDEIVWAMSADTDFSRGASETRPIPEDDPVWQK